MSALPTDTKAMAITNGARHNCRTVQRFMLGRVHQVLKAHAQNDPQGTVTALFLRAAYWVHTMDKLNYPSDFQAAIAGARALMEIAIDLSLLAGDPVKYPVDKLLAWENSTKLNHVEKMDKELTALGLTMEPVHKAFITIKGPGIRTDRNTHWGGNHPKHWAVSKGIQKAAAAADSLRGDHALEGYFVKRFSPMSWAIHGSGTQAVRGVAADDFPWLLGEALQDVAAFGMLISDRALTYVSAMTPELTAEIDRTHELRDAASMFGFMLQRHGLSP